MCLYDEYCECVWKNFCKEAKCIFILNEVMFNFINME